MRKLLPLIILLLSCSNAPQSNPQTNLRRWFANEKLRRQDSAIHSLDSALALNNLPDPVLFYDSLPKSKAHKMRYHDTTYYSFHMDSDTGYIQYRGLNGEKLTAPGYWTRKSEMTCWTRIYDDPPITPEDSLEQHLRPDGCKGTLDDWRKKYFIKIDGHIGEIESAQVIIFLRK